MTEVIVKPGYREYPPKVNMFHYAVERHAASELGDSRAMVWDGGAFTYMELEEEVNRVAAGLAHLGVKRGDMVLLRSRNHPHYCVGALACWKLGAVSVMSNSLLGPEEARHQPSGALPRVRYHPGMATASEDHQRALHPSGSFRRRVRALDAAHQAEGIEVSQGGVAPADPRRSRRDPVRVWPFTADAR